MPLSPWVMFLEGIQGGSKQSLICLETAPAIILIFIAFLSSTSFSAALLFSVIFIQQFKSQIITMCQQNNQLIKNLFPTTGPASPNRSNLDAIIFEQSLYTIEEDLKRETFIQVVNLILNIQSEQTFSVMFKTNPSFFSPLQRQHRSPMKRDSSQPTKAFLCSAQQPSRLSENEWCSQTVLPKRMATANAGGRKASGEISYKKYHHARQKSQIKSVFRRKSSESGYSRLKTEKTHPFLQSDNPQVSQCCFLSKVEQIEEEYLEHYCQENYEEAAKVLIKILNYAIDFKLSWQFLRTIKQLAEFYIIMNKNSLALFYFNQARLCSFQLDQPEVLIDSLIGCSLCCRKDELFEEAILFLKKGLEFCWFHAKPEQELIIYDEFGKIYYLMGELQKANSFHSKFIDAVLEPENSPQRSLSLQRITRLYEEDHSKTQAQMDIIFLASLSLPILSFKQLPPLPGFKQSLRSNFDISTKYLNQVPDTRRLLTKILSTTFFSTQMEEPEVGQSSKSCSPLKNRKLDFIQFKMKQYLREMGIGYRSRIEIKPNNLQYREPLDEKVRKKLKEPGLDPDWQFKMVREIKRDRQNKLFKVHSQIRVRGKNCVVRPEVDHIRKIFMPLYK